MIITCPKCRHRHPSDDIHGKPMMQCPACGLYYVKYINQKKRAAEAKAEKERKQVENEEEKVRKARNRIVEHLIFLAAGCRLESRAKIIDRNLTKGDAAFLACDPSNRHSKFAVKILMDTGDQVGFVPEQHAERVSTLLASGHKYDAEFIKILDYDVLIPVVDIRIYRPDAGPGHSAGQHIGHISPIKTESDEQSIQIPYFLNFIRTNSYKKLMETTAKAFGYIKNTLNTEHYILLIVIGILLFMLNAEHTPPPNTPAKIAQEKTERIEREAACRKDLKCWAKKHDSKAAALCSLYVKKYAKYAVRWTNRWYESPISRYRWSDRNKGAVIYIGDKVRFQNGLGAWQNMIYECDYNPEKNTILAIHVFPGKL